MNYFEFPNIAEWQGILARPSSAGEDLRPLCEPVFTDVAERGDVAVKEYVERFDRVKLDALQVSDAELAKAESEVSDELKAALSEAYANIERFHAAQRVERVAVTNGPGIDCWQEYRAIERVGLYIPGGSAPLFSTVLMLAIPAKLAGCSEIVLCTPSNSEGIVNPAILYAAKLCGVTRIFKIGGIQAIAAMSVGTVTVPKVSKIFGPGNRYVMAAKQFAQSMGVAIDMPAGPSEVLIIADKSADVRFVASDLLSQAEHGADSQVVLLTTSRELYSSIDAEVERQRRLLSRADIAQKALDNSRVVLVESVERAVNMSNMYAPEHLIICVEEVDRYLPDISNAGSVFIGNYSPESAGDYASGTNHTLPTSGYATAYSGVCLDSFMKRVSFQRLSERGLQSLGKTIVIMAESEQLDAHANAVKIRLGYE
ncbi:MAG: histidinol dehydrogenase [Marinifilaceae bacterium]|nr:histidinol dehydrogenase [Marinifilaceae bacterium]